MNDEASRRARRPHSRKPSAFTARWTRRGPTKECRRGRTLRCGCRATPLRTICWCRNTPSTWPATCRTFGPRDAHLEELLNHRRLIETRGVFARVAAEVEGESFELSDDIKNHLLALTSENKPLYKLCQACGYGESTERVLRSLGLLTKPCMVRALAITPNGLESLAAVFRERGAAREPRRDLMEQMGTAYRQATKLPDGADDALTAKVTSAFQAVFQRAASRPSRRDSAAYEGTGGRAGLRVRVHRDR